MIDIEFDLDQKIKVIQAKPDDLFQTVIDKYITESSLNPDSTFFLVNGTQLKPNKTVESQMNSMNKENKKLNVLVSCIDDINILSTKSKDIICPICHEPCRIGINNYKLDLFGCINNHKSIKTIKNFPDSQKINLSKIICDQCKIKNKGDSPNNEFYICLTCKQNICIGCKTRHNSNHNIINYDQKNYICQKHNEHVIKFCKNCNINICYLCDDEHDQHETIYLGDLKFDIKDKKNQLKEMKKQIDLFNNKIKEIIKQLNEISEIVNIYYDINNNIINSYEMKNRNHQILQNIKWFNINNKIMKSIIDINKMKHTEKQLYNIIDLYNNFNDINNNKNESNTENKDNNKAPAIGIDLGSSKCCIAVFQNDKMEIIPGEYGEELIPSYIAFTDTKKLFGDDAKKYRNPSNIIFDFIRLIGTNFNSKEIQDSKKFWPYEIIKDHDTDRPKIELTYKHDKKSYFIEEILSVELLKIKKIASKYLGKEVKDVVISAPNSFNYFQRKIIKDAAELSGLNILSIVSASSLVGIEYKLNKANNRYVQNILIFDLGGNFLNISIIEVQNSFSEVKKINGLSNIGGENFNYRLIEYCCSEFKKKENLDIMKNPKAYKRLRIACEKEKKNLNNASQVKIEIDEIMEGKDLSIDITREKFEELCDDLFKKCIKAIEHLINNSNISKEKIDEIILIGGSTRIPKIQSMIQEFFNGKSLNKSMNPDKSVAFGAAIKAAKLSKVNIQKLEKLIFKDVNPSSLGFEIFGGLMNIIIPKNTVIPCKKISSFSTVEDNQTFFLVQLFEGEKNLTKDNYLIGKMTFDGLPPGPKGQVSIEITLDIDENFNIDLTAIENITKKEMKMHIEYETYRLNEVFRKKLISEYNKEYAKRENLIKINSEIEEIFNNIKNNCNASNDELNSKKDEILDIFEKLIY